MTLSTAYANSHLRSCNGKVEGRVVAAILVCITVYVLSMQMVKKDNFSYLVLSQYINPRPNTNTQKSSTKSVKIIR